MNVKNYRFGIIGIGLVLWPRVRRGREKETE